MSRLPALSGKQLIRVLERAGWEHIRTKGSHHIMSREGGPLLAVPVHGGKSLPIGTLSGILKDAGISREQLQDLL